LILDREEIKCPTEPRVVAWEAGGTLTSAEEGEDEQGILSQQTYLIKKTAKKLPAYLSPAQGHGDYKRVQGH